MSGLPGRTFNELFMAKIATPDGAKTASEKAGLFIRDRLREVSFFDRIIPSVPVTRNDPGVVPSMTSDTLAKIIEVEPRSRGMVMTFRGQPSANFISGKRTLASFITISSELLMKTEQELLAYTMPITKVIEENSAKDIEEVRDLEALSHIEGAVQAMQNEANGGTATELSSITVGATVEYSVRKGELARAQGANATEAIFPLQKTDLVELRKMLSTRRLRPEHFLFTDPDHDDSMQWTMEDVGSQIAGETTTKGFTSNIMVGLKYTKTIKTDICRRGNVYCFTGPDFIGRNYILNSVKFYIDKFANTILFQAWMDCAAAIVNIASIVKCELYSADASEADAQGKREDNFISVSEEQLGAPNNRVASGGVFPQISLF